MQNLIQKRNISVSCVDDPRFVSIYFLLGAFSCCSQLWDTVKQSCQVAWAKQHKLSFRKLGWQIAEALLISGMEFSPPPDKVVVYACQKNRRIIALAFSAALLLDKIEMKLSKLTI